MAKLDIWDTNKAQKELFKRLGWAEDQRKRFEDEWQENESVLQNTRGVQTRGANGNHTNEDEYDGVTSPDSSDVDASANYAFKNFRLIHSQLSANPPTVVARPASPDVRDRRKADAADRLVRYFIRQYNLHEKFDACSYNTLLYGNGFLKVFWDADAGDPLEFDEESGDIEMEGDIRVEVPSPWNIYLDPDAECWEDVRYVIERQFIPWEDALFRFPEKKELLEEYRKREQNSGTGVRDSQSRMRGKHYDVVEVYEYWEKGLPYNGFLGRHGYFMKDGTLLTEIKANPSRFKAGPEDNSLGRATLPYHLFTDLDQTTLTWGRATLAYATAAQHSHNQIVGATMDSLNAHGVARLVLPEGSEIADDSITNSPWDIVRISGAQPFHFASPMQLPAAMDQMMQYMKTGIDEMQGVNEAMFGQQSREVSGFGMQYATNQGNMVRRRLFNKYVLVTESAYKNMLNIVIKHWPEKRAIYVLGEEKAFEAVEISGADINGGYDLVVEYGASLSLDPTSRRSEILTLMPLFEKAGVDMRKMLSLLKLNELEGAYDKLELAKDRQLEYFEEILEKMLYMPPRKLEDHVNMLAYASEYVMTTEYKYLEDEQKALIDAHIEERQGMVQQNMAPASGPGVPAGPSPAGQGELPAVPGGGPMDVMSNPGMGSG